MNSTYSLTFSPVFELTNTEIPHRRIICVSLIHIKITGFKFQVHQIHFISSCVYLTESISASLMRRMHSISVQKQNNLLLFRKTIVVAILNFYRRALFPLFLYIEGCFSLKTFRNTLLSLLENSQCFAVIFRAPFSVHCSGHS